MKTPSVLLTIALCYQSGCGTGSSTSMSTVVDLATPAPPPPADLATPPPPAKRIFVTSAKYLPTEIFDNTKCDLQAMANGLSNRAGTWTAWLSYSPETNPSNAIDRITDNGGALVDLKGNIIFQNAKDLAAANIPKHIINIAENMSIISDGEQVWTGTDPQGKSLGNIYVCYDSNRSWNTNDAMKFGAIGLVGNSGSGQFWTYSGASPCNVKSHIYCFEK